METLLCKLLPSTHASIFPANGYIHVYYKLILITLLFLLSLQHKNPLRNNRDDFVCNVNDDIVKLDRQIKMHFIQDEPNKIVTSFVNQNGGRSIFFEGTIFRRVRVSVW